jgi:4-hydroxybenzoate polyprenyltransferase
MDEKQTPPRPRTPSPKKAPVSVPAATVDAPKPAAAKRAPRKSAPAKVAAPKVIAPKVVAPKVAIPKVQKSALAPRAIDRIDWPHIRERLTEYARLARMDRPVGALLLLWPTWWALWLAAQDFPSIGLLIIFTLGVWFLRSAGCVINDFADRKLDPEVKRTRDRPLAAGTVSKREAIAVFLVLIVAAFLLVLLTNKLTVELSVIGAFLAITYPFMKRYTYLPQVYLGCAFGWSIPMAFAATKGGDMKQFVAVLPLCGLLFLGNVLFSTIYDTEYAMVDRDDDIRVGAKSTAILFGDADLPIIGVLMLTFLFAMLLVAQRGHLHWPYFIGLGIGAALFAYQIWLMRARARDACFAAFRNNNWVGLAIWVGIVLSYALK